MIIKNKNLIVEVLTKEDYNSNDIDFLKDKRVKDILRDKIETIRIVMINDDFIKLSSFEKENMKNLEAYSRIEFLDDDELIEKIQNKEFIYAESKNENRFYFYNDIIKLLRGILAGTTNFILIRQLFECEEFNSYSDSFVFNLD